MVKDLLDVVEGETSEDSETTVQPDVLTEGKGAHGGCREDQRGESRDSDEGCTSQKRTSDVHVFLLLSGGADERNGTHHSESVETGTGDERGRRKREQGRNEGGLGGVESSPQSVLGYVATAGKVSILIQVIQGWKCAYLSGSMDRVPIIVPKLRAKPPMATAQGFVTINR